MIMVAVRKGVFIWYILKQPSTSKAAVSTSLSRKTMTEMWFSNLNRKILLNLFQDSLYSEGCLFSV